MSRLLSLLAAVALTSLAHAQLPPAPPVGEPKPFRLPATEHFVLPNGLSVTLIPYGIAPKTAISLRIRAGGVNEGENTWISDVVAEMLQEGAGGRSAAEVATAAAAMGGDLTVGAGNFNTQISMNVLSEFAPSALKLVSDVALRPVLPANELDRVKTNLGRQLTEMLAQPSVLADVAMARTVYGAAHPFASLATSRQLASYTLDQVKAFYGSEFGAKRAQLYIAGRFDAASVKAAVKEAFGDWKTGPDPLALQSPHAAGPRVILVDRPGSPQTTLRMVIGAPVAGSAGDIPSRAMNQLLGGPFSSRIMTNIREDKGYSYSPGSGIAFTPGEALWSFEADVTTNVTGAAMKEVFGEIRRLQTTAPPEEESKGIRTYMAGLFAIQNSTSGALINTVATRDLLGLPTDWLEKYVPAVLAVDAEQIRKAAAENLPLDRMVLVALGDLKQIETQLKSLPELRGIPFQRVSVP